MIVQSWADVLVASFQQVWTQFISFVPELLGAVIIFIIGLIVASVFGALVERILGSLKVDKALARLGIEEYLERAGLRLNSGKFLGQTVYWFLIITFLLASSDILGFLALSGFLGKVLLYIPQVIVAILIMLVTIVVANFLRKVVKASVMSAKLHAANSLGALTWWSVLIFGLITALSQLGIDVTILRTLVTGVIAMFALAGGIAFGLGGKEYASHLIEKFRGQVENK